MRSSIFTTAMILAFATPAMAQVTSSDTTSSGPTASDGKMTAPDGSKAFGFVPYVGVLGGYHSFDREPGLTGSTGERFDGALIEGVVGANLPLGPLFIGVEGFGAKGFGDINWEYGVRGRGGFRAGDSGLLYASFGRTWIDAKTDRGFSNSDDWVYGLGVEVGPRDIGLAGVTGRAGPRLRLSIESYDFQSIRPMAGIIFHF
ncbi:MAG: outer membrane protein [Polymorphobacter sp.]